MTITQLEYRADRLFGREADLTLLLQRTQHSGLTAIIGPPQIGKSWLLMELARRLAHEANSRCLVGFTRSPKGANDPILQVVSDLYQRWLADARAWEQLKTVWEQQKDGLLPVVARFVGKLSDKAGRLVPVLGELGGTAISESLKGLVYASEDLRSGRLIVSRLEYSQAQELVSSVQKIAGQHVSLIMDQWEETRDLDQQRNTFRDFLREPEQWPDCHILLGAREGTEAAELLRELATDYPGGVYIHPLGEMDLVDRTERRRLVSFLRDVPQLRALENIPDDRVLELVAGYPRVISRWTGDDARNAVRTFDGITQLAKDANEFRYRDLEKLLLNLDGDRRKLAARIALVPLVEDAEAWQAMRPIIFANIDPTALDDLKLINVLEQAELPKFGHPTRRDAAQSFLETHRREAVRAEAEYLIPMLARSTTAMDVSTIHFGEALRGLRDMAARQNLGSLPLALCEAARTLLGERLSSPAFLIEGVHQARRSCEAGLGFILAGGLLNTLNDANSEDDRACRDALLGELRDLARDYPDDAAVREQLALGLFNTLNYADTENDRARSDVLLRELRDLARHFPRDAAVRGQLAGGLFNTLSCADPENDRAHRDALIRELRDLARDYPSDAAVRERLAMGLFSTLIYAINDFDFARRDSIIGELRDLARDFPYDAAVRERLAEGLCTQLLVRDSSEDGLTRLDAVLDELRDLARDFPHDPAVRERLAMELRDKLHYAAPDRACRDALLGELRDLARDFPHDPAVREQLAWGLFDTMNHTDPENDRAHRDALTLELRDLARDFPEDAAVRKVTSRGLLQNS